MRRISQNVILRRISPGSAFKVGAILGFLGMTIYCLLWVGIDLVRSNLQSYLDDLGMLCLSYLIIMIVAVIGGGIGGVIYAGLYDIAVRWVGGLEVTLEGFAYISEESSDDSEIPDKPIRSDATAPGQSSSQKACPHCGHPNPSGRVVCEYCGWLL